jgi:exopolyphosphatase/guanosine-5'-triphosphate,3'-diphosphate pyrophosphatase
MRCACVDIGSNTTRVLVADVVGGVVREVTCEKAFTRLGSPEEALEAVAETVAVQCAVARSLGAERLRVVATAAIREAGNAEALLAAVRRRAGVEVDVLAAGEEARLAFRGATLGREETSPPIRVAVVDVGGGSTEIAVGTLAGGVEWSASIPVGSSDLADAHLHSDPPSPGELADLQADARLLVSGAHPPPSDVGVAVGGSATSIGRLVPGAIDDLAVGRVLELLASAPSGRIAADHGLEPERVRLLPAGLSLLAAVAERLECPLSIGDGGLREGVCVELTTQA